MGATAAERVALLIETKADLSGAQAARTETSALSTEVKRATDAAIAAETAWKTAVNSRAEALRNAAASAGGDMEKIKEGLAGVVKREEELKKAAEAAANELERQKRILAQTGSQQLAPAGPGPQTIGPQLGPALPGLTTAAAAAESARVKLEKVPPAARQAGNALGLLATAAATGNGSISGLATATGNLAQGLSVMTGNAKVAAGAAGLGALAASAGILIALAIEAKRKIEEIPEGALTGTTQRHIANLKTVDQAEQELALARQRRDALAADPKRLAGFGGDEQVKAQQDAAAKVDALTQRVADLRRDANEKRLADEKQQRDRQISLNEAADKQLLQLENTHLDLYQKRTNDSVTATRLRIDREFADRQKEIADLKVSEERKTALLVTAARVRGEQLEAAAADAAKTRANAEITRGSESDSLTERVDARIREIDRERDAMIKAGVDTTTAVEIGEQRKRKLYSDTARAAGADAKSIVDVLLASGSRQVKAVGYAADAVRRILIGAQAAHAAVEAAIEGGKAIGSLASGDFRGAALHGAAALELAKAAALGGQESLGGGRGASGGGGGSPDTATFQPRGGDGGAGAQIINLITVNPYSRENMGIVSYELTRGGVLKRPIPISPTTGLVTV